MPSDTKNVKLGVCKIIFNGFDLGYTKGGVEVEVKTDTKKVMVDQFGNSEINEIILGRTCIIKAPLAETTLQNLAEITPGATLVHNGVNATATVDLTPGVIASTNVTVNGAAYFFRSAVNVTTYDDVNTTGLTAAEIAQRLADAINNDVRPAVADINATVSGNIVTLTYRYPGVAGNAITLATNSTATISGATFTGGVDATRSKVIVKNATSVSLRAAAKRLILHPIEVADTDRTCDFTVPLANTNGSFTFAYKLDEERIFNAEFYAYPDSATGLIFSVGDGSSNW